MPLIRKPTADVSAQTDPAPDPAKMLRTGNADQRRAAARAFGTDPHGTNPLAEALKTETDERVREAIFTSLVRLGGPESVDAVVPCLRVDDANLRTGALDAMRTMI